MGTLIFRICTALLSVVVLIAALRLWRTPRARYFILLCLAVCLYAVGYLFELDAYTLEGAYMAERVQYLGVPFIGLLFFLFIRDCVRRSVMGVKPVLLFVTPCLILVLAGAWPDSTLYFADLGFAADPSPHLIVTEGPFYCVDFIYSHGLMAAALVEIIFCFPRRNGEQRALRVSVNHITADGGVKYTYMMLYDATELNRLMGELEDLATHDGLTGLLNRSTFFRFAQQDFELSRREGVEVSVLMLDINFFKNINDRYGHQQGDEVLRKVAGILSERLRRTDICGRYGGEEFCVFLPGANTDAATLVAEIIHRAVEVHIFQSEQGGFLITVSVGLAQLAGRQYACLEELIKDADAALYEVKGGGRNRVVVFAPPEEEKELAEAR